jgi:polysaccharide transporter
MTEQSNSKKVLKGISSQTLVTLIMGVLEVVVFSIMSRLLSKEDFGLFAAISAITLIFGSLSEAGVGSALIQKKNANADYVNTSFTLSFISGSLFALLLVALSGILSKTIIDETLKVPLMLMSITILCNSLTSVNTSVMFRRLEFLQVGMVNFFALVISSSIAIGLALNGMGFEAIISKAILQSLTAAVLSFFLAKTKYRFRIERKNVGSIVNFGGWLTLSVVFRNFANQADKLLMSKFLSVASLGAYNRPKEFIDTISTKLNGIFDTALFPILSGIQDQKNSIRNAYHMSLYYMNIFSMLMALSFVFNSRFIIRLFFGSEWLDLLPVFIILSLALVFNIDGRLCDCFFRSLALVKYQFFIRILEFSLTIGCLLVGFNWGITGVAIAVLFANISIIFIKLYVITNKVGSSIPKVILRIISAWRFTLVLGPAMVVMRIVLPNTFVGDIINLIIYGILVFMLFILAPSIIGETYKEGAYKSITSRIKQKIGRK